MKVLLLDLDGKIENLALMRLSTYHKERGDEVSLLRLKGKIAKGMPGEADKVYISTLFSWNQNKANFLARAWGGKAVIGGSGYNLECLPFEVEVCQPDYSLYGQERAIGFISRGCVNNCPWCVVRRKERELARVSTAESIVGDRQEAIFLDNNFLALPDHASDLEWLAAHGTNNDFNQGLDAAFITPENARLLKACHWTSRIRLALDSLDRMQVVQGAVSILRDAGFSKDSIAIYVLIGFGGLESDVKRLLAVYEMGVNAFPMGYRKLDTGEEPARGWDRRLYKKYRRLISRVPRSTAVWTAFREELTA